MVTLKLRNDDAALLLETVAKAWLTARLNGEQIAYGKQIGKSKAQPYFARAAKWQRIYEAMAGRAVPEITESILLCEPDSITRHRYFRSPVGVYKLLLPGMIKTEESTSC